MVEEGFKYFLLYPFSDTACSVVYIIPEFVVYNGTVDSTSQSLASKDLMLTQMPIARPGYQYYLVTQSRTVLDIKVLACLVGVCVVRRGIVCGLVSSSLALGYICP